MVDDTTSRRGPAAARNIGWRRAAGPIIAFADDDTISDPRWLEEGLRAMRPGVDALAGRIVMPVCATPTDYERNEQRLERAEFVTANCFVRRAVLDPYFRLLEAGCNVGRAPSAIVVHPVRPAPWGVSPRSSRRSRLALLPRGGSWSGRF